MFVSTVKINCAAVRAAVGDAAWLASSSVWKVVGVANRSTDTSTHKQQRRPVGVNTFNILAISSIETALRSIHAVENTSWVKTNDCSDATTLHILSSKTSNVS